MYSGYIRATQLGGDLSKGHIFPNKRAHFSTQKGTFFNKRAHFLNKKAKFGVNIKK